MINIRYQHQQTLMKQETNLGGGVCQEVNWHLHVDATIRCIMNIFHIVE
jgi:hypothetical protein